MSAEPHAERAAGGPLLSMHDISKRFGAVRALIAVDLDIARGEVHAIVGENGAGKSTLMHILCGVHQPDAGEIAIDGRPARIDSERAAQERGIAIVYQERSLFGPLSVAENIFAGRQPVRSAGWIDTRRMHAEARRLLREVGLDADPRVPLGALAPAHQQLVEIAKALSLNSRLIIFDEPTAALTSTETKRLFAVIDGLRTRGTAVVYISHRLEEVFEIADRVTVLKDGRRQTTIDICETSPRELIALMVGRELYDAVATASETAAARRVVLEVRGLSDRADGHGSVHLRDINLSLRTGEIVALAGLAGAGRTETALAVFGARRGASGTVVVDGTPVRIRNPADAIRAGLGYLSEDRKESGLFLDMSISDNIAAASLGRFGRAFLNDRQIAARAEEERLRLGIVCGSVQQPVASLSGGNQQKVMLAKWLLANPRVLFVDEPTRGVDVGARSEVHRLLRELAAKGTAVVVISSDLPEVLALGDRVVVLAEGRVAGELSRAEATEERVVQLASRVA